MLHARGDGCDVLGWLCMVLAVCVRGRGLYRGVYVSGDAKVVLTYGSERDIM